MRPHALTRLLGAVLGSLLAAGTAPATAQTWQKVENLAPVIGADGKPHQAACSGFPGTDPRFAFWVRRTASKNLAVYFEGGGACWDNLTCSFPITGRSEPVPQFFVPMVAGGPQSLDGIFRTDNPANPVRDWNMVYIPYCTGDIHIGSAERTYTSLGHPTLPNPAGETFTIQHRGFDNFMVVLDWMKRNFKDPKNVLVTGASAGGYGATANSPWVGKTFRKAHLYVLADASQGVSTPGFDTGNPGRLSWNPQLAPWVFDPASPPPGGQLMRKAAQGQPHAKVAQFTTSFDEVQIEFYGVMKQFYGPGGSCPNPIVDWYQQMSRQLVADAHQVDNFRFYLAGGTYHTLLRSPAFYTENSAGPSFAEWMTRMLGNRGGTGGHGGRFDNVACPGCLVDLPCAP